MVNPSGYWHFEYTGSLQDLRYAMEAALETVKDRGVLISSVIIPSLNPELIKHLI